MRCNLESVMKEHRYKDLYVGIEDMMATIQSISGNDENYQGPREIFTKMIKDEIPSDGKLCVQKVEKDIETLSFIFRLYHPDWPIVDLDHVPKIQYWNLYQLIPDKVIPSVDTESSQDQETFDLDDFVENFERQSASLPPIDPKS